MCVDGCVAGRGRGGVQLKRVGCGMFMHVVAQEGKASAPRPANAWLASSQRAQPGTRLAPPLPPHPHHHTIDFRPPQGLVTVRAFRQQAAFEQRNLRLMDESNRAYWPAQVLQQGCLCGRGGGGGVEGGGVGIFGYAGPQTDSCMGQSRPSTATDMHVSCIGIWQWWAAVQAGTCCRWQAVAFLLHYCPAACRGGCLPSAAPVSVQRRRRCLLPCLPPFFDQQV